MTRQKNSPPKSNKTFDAAERVVANLGPWRYLQFVIVGLVGAAIAYAGFDLNAWFSGAIGGGIGITYFALEKARGVI